jgi:hypothetical protein
MSYNLVVDDDEVIFLLHNKIIQKVASGFTENL